MPVCPSVHLSYLLRVWVHVGHQLWQDKHEYERKYQIQDLQHQGGGEEERGRGGEGERGRGGEWERGRGGVLAVNYSTGDNFYDLPSSACLAHVHEFLCVCVCVCVCV